MQKVMECCEFQMAGDTYKPVTVDEDVMLSLKTEEVYIIDYTSINRNIPFKFYKNMMPREETII